MKQDTILFDHLQSFLPPQAPSHLVRVQVPVLLVKGSPCLKTRVRKNGSFLSMAGTLGLS